MSKSALMEEKTTYVYNETEIVLTGRSAERVTTRLKLTLYEISPANQSDGSWKKWVRMAELYEIK